MHNISAEDPDPLSPEVLGEIHRMDKDAAHLIMKQANFPGCPICPAISQMLREHQDPNVPRWMTGRRCE